MSDSVSYFKKLYKAEVAASNHYLAQSAVLRSRGFVKLADKLHAESDEERGHATSIIDRALVLGVDQTKFFDDAKVTLKCVGVTIPEMLYINQALEKSVVSLYKEAIIYFDGESKKDYVTIDMLTKLLADEELHVFWIESQIKMMKEISEGIYCLRWV